MTTLNLGPDPELSRQAREAFADVRPASRKRHDTGGKWSSLKVELGPIASGFANIVTKIGERARERGEIGEGATFVWSVAEWKRFFRAVREEPIPEFWLLTLKHQMAFVEPLLAAGKSAREIHRELYWAARKDAQEQERLKQADADARARSIALDYEQKVQAEMTKQRVAIEARERLKAERDDSYAPRTPGRVTV